MSASTVEKLGWWQLPMGDVEPSEQDFSRRASGVPARRQALLEGPFDVDSVRELLEFLDAERHPEDKDSP